VASPLISDNPEIDQLEGSVQYLLKSDRGSAAEEIDNELGEQILARGRHQGRRVVELFVLEPDGKVDRYLERARRKLGSNAIVSRTWLCETCESAADDAWGNDRYVPEPADALKQLDPQPEAVMLVLTGAEGDSKLNAEQLNSIGAAS